MEKNRPADYAEKSDPYEYGPFDSPEEEVKAAEEAFEKENGRKATDEELSEFMTSKHPSEVVNPVDVEREQLEPEEVEADVIQKVIDDFKGLYNREPTDDELEEAFQARAGGNVDIVPLHRDLSGLKEEEKGNLGQREINEAVEAFKEKNGREPNE